MSSLSFKRSTLSFLPPLLLAVYYYIFSLNATGFYQHDEIGHLLQILDFRNSPLKYLLDMWSRGGYKLLFAVPGMLGQQAVALTNILLVAASAWLSTCIAEKYKLPHAWLAGIFTGLQPLVVQLSFRCYPEIPSMFFTTLLIYLYINRRYTASAFIASYLFTIRQELAVFGVLLGIFFLYKKNIRAFLLLTWAPLALHVLGWIVTGDSLFLLHSLVQGGLIDTYQRNGFFYLWLMLPEITGSIIFLLFLFAACSWLLGNNRWQRLQKYHAVVVVFSVYFLMHCLFTSEFFGFGRSGGLTRFLLVITPTIGILAAAGLHAFVNEIDRQRQIATLVISSAIIFTFLLLQDKIAPLVFSGLTVTNNLRINSIILLAVILIAIVFIFSKKNPTRFKSISRQLLYALTPLLALAYSFSLVRPIEPIMEDTIAQGVAEWVHKNNPSGMPLFTNHVALKYYYLKAGASIDEIHSIDSTQINAAPHGSIYISENHYAAQYDKCLFNFRTFQLINEVSVNDYPFKVYILRKF